MKPTAILFAALVATALAGCARAQHHPHADAAATASAPGRNAPAANRTAASGKPTASVARPVATGADTTHYRCQRGAYACPISSPLVANSQAQAQWLLAHGYPSHAERARLDRMDLAQLKAESQAGNNAATVLYGTRTAVSGRFHPGLAILSKAAAAGNLYAYYGLSEVYASDTAHKNLVDSAAYLRLAYLLGDGKAASAIAAKGLSSIENVVADERAAALYQTFAKNRQLSRRRKPSN
ncbi:hypothetical protein MUG10_09965 [Xanthomonas prunicola]|uniref:Sel1 repeat family protein n=1 Tax=Xanthomonas prunicola TaxID=2053930 RepID=A0A9Q9J374_9XANT|nr:hypothetical protein [Xanthomonas prunicola]USJ02381.1 hypothetical protein MUG10_09965 [Xanthomonas prunicola]UXA50898.1 hypothetical protein M0D44_10690 [Xanthomonas prunicola]UXA59206.1 hypothetical protein M0D47_10730 [Xanthomonas prunicola]UXA67414.1 hypothetical protein M0D43_10955 [Xanthomonas prunicola]